MRSASGIHTAAPSAAPSATWPSATSARRGGTSDDSSATAASATMLAVAVINPAGCAIVATGW